MVRALTREALHVIQGEYVEGLLIYAGHSYPQLAEAAGVSIGVIQRMVAEP